MANSTISHKVSDALYLVRQELGSQTQAPKKVAAAVNHMAVIDCSGSMYYDLPKIREQLKKRIPKILKDGDTLSLVWFSGRREFGTLLEAEPVATLADLKDVNHAIDRWLRPVGLTGFKEPLQEVKALVGRIAKKNGNPFGLVFMSDGWDNQWSKGEILKAVEDISGQIASAVFVEYGNYADRQLLAKMAEKAGGTLIHSEDFDRYAPLFEAAVTKGISGAPRVEVAIKGDTIEGFAFALDGNELLSFDASTGKIAVPEDLTSIAYLSPTSVGAEGRPLEALSKDGANPNVDSADLVGLNYAYAAASLFSVRMKPNVVLPLLKSLGDVRFIQQFGGCFGKQKYSEFMEATKTAATAPAERFADGWDPNKVPPDDAFTVLDFLRVLNSDDSNRVLLDSKDFKYSRIGRPATPVVEKDDKGNEIPSLEFNSEDAPDGYPVSTLTYNETRPNVSILVRKEGTVDLSQRLKGSGFEKKIPSTFPTFVFRNYTIIRDGIINVERLPVRMTGGTVRQLREAGLPLEAIEGIDGEERDKAVTRVKKASNDRPVSFVVNLKALPVINRNMVKDASAKALFEKQWELTKARAAQKVFNDIKKERFPRESEGFKQVYGEDAAAWLKEQGFTDYSGFGPKTEKAAAQDQYVGKELKVSLKGLSSLPSVKEAKQKIASGKATARHELLRPALDEAEEFLDSSVYKKAKDKDKVFAAWLDDQVTATKTQVRKLLYEVSQIRFGVVVGQTWFNEFKSLDDTSLDVKVDGQTITGNVEMKEIQIDI